MGYVQNIMVVLKLSFQTSLGIWEGFLEELRSKLSFEGEVRVDWGEIK